MGPAREHLCLPGIGANAGHDADMRCVRAGPEAGTGGASQLIPGRAAMVQLGVYQPKEKAAEGHTCVSCF